MLHCASKAVVVRPLAFDAGVLPDSGTVVGVAQTHGWVCEPSSTGPPIAWLVMVSEARRPLESARKSLRPGTMPVSTPRSTRAVESARNMAVTSRPLSDSRTWLGATLFGTRTSTSASPPLIRSARFERVTISNRPDAASFAEAATAKQPSSAATARTSTDMTPPLSRKPAIICASNHSGVVSDLAVHDGENRPRLARLGVADAEIVAIEHHEIGELADLDRAEILLAVQVPGVGARVGVQRLLPADLLARIDLLAEDVEAGGRVVHREPRVMRRDVHAVLVHAGRDAAREDLRVERPIGPPVGARGPVQPGAAGR